MNIKIIPNPQNMGWSFVAQVYGGPKDGKYLGEFFWDHLTLAPDPQPFFEWIKDMTRKSQEARRGER